MPNRPYRILIVDDSPEDQETVRRYLTRGAYETYDVHTAETAEEALALYKQYRFDCVLLDYHLPDMNGLEFVGEIVYETPDHLAPIVMLTGTGSEDIAVEAMKRGVQDYLVKGRVAPDALRRSVHYAMDRVEILRKLERQRLELEQKNQELELANQRKDAFLAMLAHELRNPLAPILNALYVQRLRGGDNPNVDRLRNVVERQVQHLARLTDDLLDVARITQSKILLRKEPLDIVALVRQVVEDHRATLDDAGITLDLELPKEPLRVNGDRTRLAQVLSNLLSNAAKFTDAGGNVQVRVAPRADGRRVAVSVRDTGIGMTPEMLHRVFDTFSQADESLDRSKGGLGLGLALAKGLVELHDGDLRAYSGGPARGSEFTFTLPLDSRHIELAPTGESQPEKLPAKPQHRNLLLVEDNRDAAETLSELLELWGYTVWVAHNGPAGLQAALMHKPEIAILDIGLPGMDGYELAERIHAELENTVLVALTGYGQDEDRRRSRAAGFEYHLTKPVDPEELQQLLIRIG